MTKLCIGCGIEFIAKSKVARFCSIRCSKIGRLNPRWKGGVKKIICQTCGIEFLPDSHINRKRTFCSVACAKKGVNNPNWGGKVGLTGSNHPFWKGDQVQLDALHVYIRRILPCSGKCQCCGSADRLDLANISQQYKRDVLDWEWLCRRCHMKKDGRMANLTNRAGKGELNHKAKLSESDVLTIYRLISAGETNSAIARQFMVDPSTIGNIKTGKIWKHIHVKYYSIQS